MKNNNGEKLMKPRQAANYLNIHVGTLNKYRKQGRGPPYILIEGNIGYRRAMLDAYLDEKGVMP